MKKFVGSVALLALMLGVSMMALAQNTIGGTEIRNTASATFTDSNGVDRTTNSNTVTTIVQTVYSFNIEPDDGLSPQDDGTQFSDYLAGPGASSPDADGFNDVQAIPGGNAVFTYTLTNNTNNADTIDLSVIQDSATDDFDFSAVAVSVHTYTDVDGNGQYDEGVDTLGAVVVSGGSNVSVPFAAQGDSVAVIVTATVPAGAGAPQGNDVALFDLTASSQGADALNSDADPGNDQVGPMISYEDSNVARATITEEPIIGVAKAVATPVNNGDGTYTLVYTFNVENLGNVVLSNVQVTDDLASVFADATAYSVTSVTATGLSANNPAAGGSFDGDSDTNLLTGSDSLAIGASASITLTVVVEPGADLGPYNNTATATAESPNNSNPAGADTSDQSTNGTDADPNGDGNPAGTGEDAVTPVSFTETPVLGVAKSATPATEVAGAPGVFESTITITLENLGDVELRNVQASDDLTNTFVAPTTFTVVSGSVSSSTLTVNPGYDGDATTTLLAGSDTLAAGASATVTFVVQFDPNGATGPFNNTATGTATSPAGTTLTDDSQNGSDANPDTDNDPTNNDTATPITITENPVIGVAKTASTVTEAAGFPGQFETTFTLTIENLGNVTLNNVQVTEDLASVFAAPATYTLTAPPTSSSLTINTNFDTASDTNLLTGTDTLEPGEVATVTLSVRFDPNGVASFSNQVEASATSPAGATTTDASDDGTEPDTDGDGQPNEATENDPTVFVVPETPVIGLAKDVSVPVNNNDGSYDLTYTFTVENLGNVDLNNVQINDDLASVFGASNYLVNNVNSSVLTENTGFNGDSVTALLAGTDSLAVGDSATVTVSLTITPGSNLGPYNNSATVSADSPANPDAVNPEATDTSDNGTNPDADGDGQPDEAGENDPTPVSFTENPVLGVAKAATASVDAAGVAGEFETTITITVENLGDVELRNVQVNDDLDASFAGATYTVISGPSSSSLTVNANFDGSSDINLLAGTQTLAVGESGTVSFTVRFNPNGLTGPFVNVANGSATSPANASVTDVSTDGNDPDADGDNTDGTTDNDGNPDEDTETLITFTERPVVGVAKSASVLSVGNTDPNAGPLGPFEVQFEFRVENFGNVELNSLTLQDDLSFFGAYLTDYIISSAPSISTPAATSTVTVNPSYTGATPNTFIIEAGSNSKLAVNEFVIIRFTAEVYTVGSYLNQATAEATNPSGTIITNDLSDDGSNPDTDADNQPNEAGENDPTPINLDALQLEKSARVCADANCSTVIDTSGVNAKPGQFIEYTIVATNLGGQELDNVVITDDVPSWTTPVAGRAEYTFSTSTSAGLLCDQGSGYAVCPTGTVGEQDANVVSVRLNVGTLSANDGLSGGTDSATLVFVVYVP